MEYHIILSGRVQAVGFRWFTLNLARNFNIAGWVRNTIDGNVEILAQGDEKELEIFFEKVKIGPPSAKVTSVKLEKRTIINNKYNSFEVIH